MHVKEAMTPGVIIVSENATLWDALDAMVKHKVSALVVNDNEGKAIGVLSEGDLLRRAELGTQKHRPGWVEFLLGGGRAAKDYVHTHGRRVGEVMTRGVIGVTEDADVSEAVDLMMARRIKRLVVLRDAKAVGVLSRSDLIKMLVARLPNPNAPASDHEIRAAIEAEIGRQSWTPRGSVRVSVADGIVTFEGAIADDRLRPGLRVLAENTPGVKKVRDRMAWIETSSGVLVPAPEEDAD